MPTSPKLSSQLVQLDINSVNFSPENDPFQNRAIPLDQALFSYFPGPHSFTGEDIIELHTHGYRAFVSYLLSTLASLSLSSTSSTSSTSSKTNNYLLRPADRGECTQRAYSNGKLGLVEVEALADLTVSDTAMQRRQALLQLDGRATKVYDRWREESIKGSTHDEAVIDFVDDEDLVQDDDDDDDDMNHIQNAKSLVWGNVRKRVETSILDMNRFLKDDRRGEIVRYGVRITIVGLPNAGKSSL